MKVLFITRKYPPSTGGMEQFAYDLHEALAAKIDVKLVKWSGTGRLKAILVALPTLGMKSTVALAGGGLDIIHAQDGVVAPLGYVLSRLFRKPFTVVIHGLDLTYGNPIFRSVVPWCVRRADTVFCISQSAAEEARKHGVADNRIQVVPLAVTDKLYGKSSRKALLEQLHLPSETKLLLTVGRLVKRKGVAWFIDAVLPDLVEQYPQLIYLVVGEGPETRSIEAAIELHKLDKNVRLPGRVTGSLYEAAYNGADIFVMPNITVPGDIEGFGLVLLEASVCALPVVAADTEGIKDAVTDGRNGVLVPVRDAATFAAQIKRFLDDPDYATQFGKNSRLFTLENYQWSKIADRYIDSYEELLG
ncbi:MAG TPA: glycosyltransferase family 4 protein [Candidatus Saccharimonadales bacterium]